MSWLSNSGRHFISLKDFFCFSKFLVIFGNGWSRRRVQAPGSRWWFLRWTTLYHHTSTTVAAATATCVVGRVVVSRAAFHPPYALLHTPVGARRPTMLLPAAALLRICEGGFAFFATPPRRPNLIFLRLNSCDSIGSRCEWIIWTDKR